MFMSHITFTHFHKYFQKFFSEATSIVWE